MLVPCRGGLRFVFEVNMRKDRSMPSIEVFRNMAGTISIKSGYDVIEIHDLQVKIIIKWLEEIKR